MLCQRSFPYFTLPYPTLPYLILPYPTLPYLALSYHALLYPTLPYLPYLTLPCLALPCLALPYPALPCPALLCPALSCLALPCLPYPTLPCPALPCLILPCPALPCLTLPYLTLPCLTSPYLALNCEGCWGTTDDFTASFLHFYLFSAARWDLANSRPVHSLMLSAHLFFCLSCLLPHFTVPCKMVLARHDERETCPYHVSLRLFTMIRRSSCGPIACWILAGTSSLVTWSLYEKRSILR